MMKIVRNRASPTSAMFGGIAWVVRARRMNESTIMIRVKDVIMTSREGRSARIVKTTASLTGADHPASPSFPAVEDVALSASFRS